MRPDDTADDAGQPGGRSAAPRTSGLVVAVVVAAVAGVVVELLDHGTAIEHWDIAANLGLCAAAAIASVALWWRWLLDRRAHVPLFALAATAWAAGQLTWVTLNNGWGISLWPGPADIAFGLVPVFALAAMLVRLQTVPARSAAWPSWSTRW